MSGELPRTTSGTPSYRLAVSLVRTHLDEILGKLQDEYGLTSLEMADITADAARYWVRVAVRSEQSRSEHRQGAIT